MCSLLLSETPKWQYSSFKEAWPHQVKNGTGSRKNHVNEFLESVNMTDWVVTDFVNQVSLKTLKPELVCARGRLSRHMPFAVAHTRKASEKTTLVTGSRCGVELKSARFMNACQLLREPETHTDPSAPLRRLVPRPTYSSHAEWKTYIQTHFPDQKGKPSYIVRVLPDWLTAMLTT